MSKGSPDANVMAARATSAITLLVVAIAMVRAPGRAGAELRHHARSSCFVSGTAVGSDVDLDWVLISVNAPPNGLSINRERDVSIREQVMKGRCEQFMKTQHIVRGVLVRPLETFSTNFLSTKYYNGQHIVDLLENETDARTWLAVMEDELETVGGFALTEQDLPTFRLLRNELESLYEATVGGAKVERTFAELLSGLQVAPQVHKEANVPGIWWSSDSPGPRNLETSIILSACITVTGPSRTRIRKCHAPKCVLYFTKGHEKQHWCSSVCGNRARVARHANRIPAK